MTPSINQNFRARQQPNLISTKKKGRCNGTLQGVLKIPSGSQRFQNKCWANCSSTQEHGHISGGYCKLFMVTRGSALQATFDDCFLDSDATYHVTSHHAWFITYKPLDPRDIVYLGDNYSHHQIHGKGKVAIRLMTNDVKIIQEVYHVLALFHNVLSVRQIVAAGYIVTFSKRLVTLESVEDGCSFSKR